VVAFAKIQGQEGTKERAVAETPWRAFTIFEGARVALKAPARDRELLTWDKPVSFEFEWTEDELLSRESGYSYQVAVSRDAEFKQPLLGPRLRDTVMPSSKVALDNGTYFWKVMIVDEAGQIVKGSEAWKFAYGMHPPLAAPEPVSPAMQAVFDVVADETVPAITWREVPGAEGYEILLYKVEPGRETASVGPDGAPAGFKLISKAETDKLHAEFKDLPPSGYAWSVRAIDRLKRKGRAMQPRPFTVTYGDVLGAPKITSPEVQ
jgi:hypothetical protein